MHTIVCVADFLADLAVTLQSAALGLGSGFAARLAFLLCFCWSCVSWLRAGDADIEHTASAIKSMRNMLSSCSLVSFANISSGKAVPK